MKLSKAMRHIYRELESVSEYLEEAEGYLAANDVTFAPEKLAEARLEVDRARSIVRLQGGIHFMEGK